MDNRLKIGLTHGDINGISYELIVKMFAENKLNEICVPVLYGSSKVLAYYKKTFENVNFNLNTIQKPNETNDKRLNIINCVNEEEKVEVGKETDESNLLAMKALLCGLNDLDKNLLSALVVAPQSDASYSKENAEGCIDFFCKRYNVSHVMQLMVGEKMKMGFVTTKMPMNEIHRHITTENILKKLQLLDETLRLDFTIRKPRIAVLALNPNSGTKGFYGNEEKEIILPAIEKARDKGIVALGPYPSDKLFVGIDYEKFDAILALYDEQGIVPFKAIEGYAGASYLAGLPKVVTFTVNSPAYDIAGRGCADESGLRNALYLGIDVYNRRMQNSCISGNPLPHYDIGGSSNESDMNVEQLVGGMREDF